MTLSLLGLAPDADRRRHDLRRTLRAAGSVTRALVLAACVALSLAACRSQFLPSADGAPAAASCAESCSRGCCDGDGVCRDGVTSVACGSGGAACSACGEGAGCVVLADGHGGRCAAACGPQNCDGCCRGTTCVKLAVTDEKNCGTGGESCALCPVGDLCIGGCVEKLATCSAANCPGCCLGSYCAVPSRQLCGRAGEACKECGPGLECAVVGGGGECAGSMTCSPLNCPGCCLGNVCRRGDQSVDECGSNGDACRACANGDACVGVYPLGGTCEPPGSCVSKMPREDCFGCCGHGECRAGHDDTACGGDGSACQDCTSFGATCTRQRGNGLGWMCEGGQAPCSPANCTGCCYGDVCAVGTQAVACGQGGNACVTCRACVNGKCG